MKSKKVLIYITSLFSLFLIYTFVALGFKDNMFVPMPHLIFKASFNLLKSGYTYQVLFTYFIRLFVSVVLGYTIGLLLAVTSFRFPTLYIVLKPYMSLFRSIPIVSISLILFFLFGSSISLYFIIFLISVPIVFEGIYNALNSTDKSLINSLRIYRGFNFRSIFTTLLPTNFSHLKTSLIQIIGFTAKVLVTAEFITNAPFSIGHEIMIYSDYLMYDYVYAWTLFLVVVVFITDVLF